MTTRPIALLTRPLRNPQPRTAAKCTYLLLCSLSLAISTAPAFSEELSHNEMVCAINPECTMPFFDRRLRGITTTASVHTPGSFDRTVNFPFNSAELTAHARSELDKVAEALNDPSVAKYPIVVLGHTDAVGSDEYNQRLSERRAEAVRQYLITQHGIDAHRLTAKGYGKSKLLLPNDPDNELNRRVQFQNPNYHTAAAEGTVSPPSARPVPSAPSPVPSAPSPVPSPQALPETNGL